MTAPIVPPEILKSRRRQLCVAHRVLDGAVTEPILDSARIVARIGQSETAGVTQHVGMDVVVKSSALTDALYKSVDSVRSEWSPALSSEDEAAFGELPA
jgi:hypothetical protein